MQFANNQAKFSFGGHGVRHQAGRGQVPRLQPGDPAQPPKPASPLGRAPLLASLQRTAIMTSDKFKGVRLNLEPGQPARGIQTTPSRKRPRTSSTSTTVATAIEIGFNVTYLIDALTNMGQEMVKHGSWPTATARRCSPSPRTRISSTS